MAKTNNGKRLYDSREDVRTTGGDETRDDRGYGHYVRWSDVVLFIFVPRPASRRARAIVPSFRVLFSFHRTDGTYFTAKKHNVTMTGIEPATLRFLPYTMEHSSVEVPLSSN